METRSRTESILSEGKIVKAALAILARPTDEKSQDIAERVESRMTAKQLSQLLLPFENSINEATQENMNILKEYLRERAARLLGTPNLYCYRPTLLANEACITLAKELTKLFPYRVIKLLLPMVQIPFNFESKHFNDFVVTEDGYLVNLLQALDAARDDKHHEFHHPARRKTPKGDYERLDFDLLTEHSIDALNYAKQISSLLRKPTVDDIERCNIARQYLLQELEKSNYYRYKPAYKERGKKRLMLSLTKNILSLQELAEFMDSYVLKTEWKEFLKEMDRDELCRIVIPMRSRSGRKKDQKEEDYKKEQAVIALPAMYELVASDIELPKSDIAKRILVYILVFLQHELRNDGPEYLNYGNGWLGGITGQSSKTDVSKITAAMQDFLLTDEDMRDIDSYLVAHKITVNSYTSTLLKQQIITSGRCCTYDEVQQLSPRK